MRVRVKIGAFTGTPLSATERVRFVREVERRVARLAQGRPIGPPGEFGAAADDAARQAFTLVREALDGETGR